MISAIPNKSNEYPSYFYDFEEGDISCDYTNSMDNLFPTCKKTLKQNDLLAWGSAGTARSWAGPITLLEDGNIQHEGFYGPNYSPTFNRNGRYAKFLHWVPANEKVIVYEDNKKKASQITKAADVIFLMDLNKLLAYSVDSGASDLHLSVRSIPMVRINGTMQPLNMEPLDNSDMESILPQVLDEDQMKIFEDRKEID